MAALAFGRSAYAADAAPIHDNEVTEVVVTAVRGKAAEVAPVKSSLQATQPEAVITRQFIEEWAPRVGDFTTSSSLAPSMVSVPNPNGPGATDGAKIAMRGFTDGQFNVTYDGIAWGDTNGPSHHSNSFFPNSTIGGIVIDRGPGGATDLGQAGFGGSLNLFSLPFENHFTVRQTATAGSFGTYQGVTTLATGPIAALHDANFVMNVMEYKTDGYLTHSPSAGFNQFIKFKAPVTSHFSITGLYTRNYDDYYLSDTSTPGTVADTTAHGKRFALSNDPTQQNYWKYNYTSKQTDFGYIRENADFGRGFSAENTSYTYWYTNSTESGANTSFDTALADAGGTNLAKDDVVTLTPQGSYPAPGKGYTDQVYGLPGYIKRNEYRVRGDVLKFYKDFDFGRLTVGGMYEVAKSERYIIDIDLLNNQPDYREKAPALMGPSGCGSLPVQTNGACETPLNINYDEYSGWHQYQAFTQFDWRPIDGLTITPGVKYVNFQLYVAAPEEAVKGSQNPSYTSGTYTKTLPYLTANYHIKPTWSVYAQYAQGFLVPNIGAYYVQAPSQNKVVPQLSTNYQIGTVYSAGKLTFDADVYYIDFKNKIQTETILTGNDVGETYDTNSGGATYYGVEGEATYLLPAGFSIFANGSSNSAIGKDDLVNPGNDGHQLALVPLWTAALGFRFQHHGLFRSDDELIVGLDGKEIGPQYETAASGKAAPTGLIGPFAQADMTTTYKLGNYAIEVQVLNLGDSQAITSFKGSALIAGTNRPATTIAEGGAANLFTYQVGRSFQVTLKAAF
jgi:iron complex outermembrane receptor protein